MTIKKWQFDAAAAENFSTIAQREIPDYQRVIDQCVRLAKKLNLENPKIIDVGSATGATLYALHQSGFHNLYGVDSSAEMLSRSFAEATLIQSEQFPVEHGPFDVVLANWVLHFIPQREEYLQDICAALSENGILILSEKLTGSEMANDLYYDFKRDNGLTEQQIEEKKQRLEGVLTTYPIDWYFQTFKQLGFQQVDVINANAVFVTFLASQRKVAG